MVQCASRVCMQTSMTGSCCWERRVHHKSILSAKSRGWMVQLLSITGDSDSFVNIEARSTQSWNVLFASLPSDTI